jgi:hypothetical protein
VPVDFGGTRRTSNPRLRYEHRGVNHWRYVEAGTWRTVGRVYLTERELLADLAAVAAMLTRTSAIEAQHAKRRRAADEARRAEASAARERRRQRERQRKGQT